jgi:hypothetical protein
MDPVGSGQGPMAGSCKYGDEPSGSGTMDLVSKGRSDSLCMHVGWNKTQ